MFTDTKKKKKMYNRKFFNFSLFFFLVIFNWKEKRNSCGTI